MSTHAVDGWHENALQQPKHVAEETVIIQKPDGSLLEEPHHRLNSTRDHYYAEVAPADVDEQANVVARIVAMAFDVFGARHLEVRVQSKREGAELCAGR